MLKLLHAKTIPRLDEDKLPSRLVMLRWGANDAAEAGRIIVNETTLRELPRNQSKSNRPRVALDFSHNTLEGGKTNREPAKVAGYGAPKVVEGEGLVFDDIEWTEEGRDAVLGGHYRELSAAVRLNQRDEVVWCHSGALTRHGQVSGLSVAALAAADPFGVNAALMAGDDDERTTKGEAGDGTGPSVRAEIRRLQEDGMTLVEIGRRVDRDEGTLSSILSGEIENPPDTLLSSLKALAATAPSMNEEKLRELLATVLGHFVDVGEQPTDADLEDAARRFAEKADGKTDSQGKTETEGVKALAAAAPKLREEVETLRARLPANGGGPADPPENGEVTALSARLEALEKHADAREREAIRERALREGKLVPLSAEDLPLDQYRKLVDELPADQVPLERRTPEGVKALSATGAAGGGETEVDRSIRAALGISEDAWKNRDRA